MTMGKYKTSYENVDSSPPIKRKLLGHHDNYEIFVVLYNFIAICKYMSLCMGQHGWICVYVRVCVCVSVRG